jgi:hypothetical protein
MLMGLQHTANIPFTASLTRCKHPHRIRDDRLLSSMSVPAAAAIARKLYMTQGIGIGKFRKLFGGANNRRGKVCLETAHRHSTALQHRWHLRNALLCARDGGRQVSEMPGFGMLAVVALVYWSRVQLY